MNNTSTNASVVSSQEMFVSAVIVPIIFGIIFLVGIVGNGLLVYTVLVHKTMRTNPNVFLISLAVGDFLLLFASVPFTATFYTVPEWTYGEGICKLNEFMQTLSLGVSIFTLTAVTGDRFVAIVYPMASYRWSTMRRTLQICAFLWTFAVCLAVPDIVGANVGPCRDTPDGEDTFLVCSVYPKEWGDSYARFRPVFRFVVYFLVPILIISSLYVVIAKTLLSRPSVDVRDPNVNCTASSWARQMHARRKVAKTVLCIVVLFVVCWAPRHVYVLWFRFTDVEFDMTVHFVKITASCLMFAYSCVNPVALYVVSDDFRRYFDHHLFGCCCKSRRFKSRRRMTATSDVIIGLQQQTANNYNHNNYYHHHSGVTNTPGSTPNLSLRDV